MLCASLKDLAKMETDIKAAAKKDGYGQAQRKDQDDG